MVRPKTHLRMFTHVYACLRMLTQITETKQFCMFTNDSHVYAGLRIFTHDYAGFMHVYASFKCQTPNKIITMITIVYA
jgi:hypothetical protein